MSTYVFFNVQVLPVLKGARNIGVEGYVRLFDALGETVKQLRHERRLHEYGQKVGHIFWLSPFEVGLRTNYIAGRFLKYDQPDSIKDLYTAAVAVKVARDQSAHRHEIPFQFDPEIHIMAVDRAHLGPPAKFAGYLCKVLRPFVDVMFEQHTVTVTLLTSAERLEHVMDRAKGFKRIELEITYSNSDDTIKGFVKQLESELKANNIVQVEHSEKSDLKGFLQRPTRICSAMLALASKYGRATIRFLNQQNKVETFVSEDNPIREKLMKYKTETFEEYEKRVYEATRNASKKAAPEE